MGARRSWTAGIALTLAYALVLADLLAGVVGAGRPLGVASLCISSGAAAGSADGPVLPGADRHQSCCVLCSPAGADRPPNGPAALAVAPSAVVVLAPVMHGVVTGAPKHSPGNPRAPPAA